MLIFFFSASALSAFHLYNESKFMVIGNPVILEQSHAHNDPDFWDRGSTYLYFEIFYGGQKLHKYFGCLLIKDVSLELLTC